MPNGGSDCCGTCWFNKKNKGQAGYRHARDPEPAFCIIRDHQIEAPFWMYCANHPHRSSNKDPIPIGPVTIDRGHGRQVWIQSPDTEEIRLHLLELLSKVEQQPEEEYPIGIYRDEVVVWQLGEFREARAIEDLERIARFSPRKTTGEPFHRTRASLVQAAERALERIKAGPEESV